MGTRMRSFCSVLLVLFTASGAAASLASEDPIAAADASAADGSRAVRKGGPSVNPNDGVAAASSVLPTAQFQALYTDWANATHFNVKGRATDRYDKLTAIEEGRNCLTSQGASCEVVRYSLSGAPPYFRCTLASLGFTDADRVAVDGTGPIFNETLQARVGLPCPVLTTNWCDSYTMNLKGGSQDDRLRCADWVKQKGGNCWDGSGSDDEFYCFWGPFFGLSNTAGCPTTKQVRSKLGRLCPVYYTNQCTGGVSWTVEGGDATDGVTCLRSLGLDCAAKSATTIQCSRTGYTCSTGTCYAPVGQTIDGNGNPTNRGWAGCPTNRQLRYAMENCPMYSTRAQVTNGGNTFMAEVPPPAVANTPFNLALIKDFIFSSALNNTQQNIFSSTTQLTGSGWEKSCKVSSTCFGSARKRCDFTIEGNYNIAPLQGTGFSNSDVFDVLRIALWATLKSTYSPGAKVTPCFYPSLTGGINKCSGTVLGPYCCNGAGSSTPYTLPDVLYVEHYTGPIKTGQISLKVTNCENPDKGLLGAICDAAGNSKANVVGDILDVFGFSYLTSLLGGVSLACTAVDTFGG